MNTFETIGFYIAIGIAVVSCATLARTVLVGIVVIISESFANFLSAKNTKTKNNEA